MRYKKSTTIPTEYYKCDDCGKFVKFVIIIESKEENRHGQICRECIKLLATISENYII